MQLDTHLSTRVANLHTHAGVATVDNVRNILLFNRKFVNASCNSKPTCEEVQVRVVSVRIHCSTYNVTAMTIDDDSVLKRTVDAMIETVRSTNTLDKPLHHGATRTMVS